MQFAYFPVRKLLDARNIVKPNRFETAWQTIKSLQLNMGIWRFTLAHLKWCAV